MHGITKPVSYSQPKEFCDGELRTTRGRLISWQTELRANGDGNALLSVCLPWLKPGQRVTFEVEELV